MPRPARRVDPALLNAALEGLELQKQRIDEQIRKVQALLGRPKAKAAAAPKVPAKARRRKPLTAAARRRISLAQKRRWAEYRKRVAAAGKE